MPTPFPGMDPYLERTGVWEEVHTRLLVAIADALGPQVRPKYRVGVEQRTYLAVLTPDEYELVGKPDVLVAALRHQVQPVHATTTAGHRPKSGAIAHARRDHRAPFGGTRRAHWRGDYCY